MPKYKIKELVDGRWYSHPADSEQELKFKLNMLMDVNPLLDDVLIVHKGKEIEAWDFVKGTGQKKKTKKKDKIVNYFAYGSNLHEPRMLERIPSAKFVGKGYVLKSKFEFRKVANVRSDKTSKAYGVVYSMTFSDLRVLDRYEGHPHLYKRSETTVFLDGGKKVTAWIYIMVKDKAIVLRTGELTPDQDYYNIIVSGYQAHGFPTKVLDVAYLEAKKKTVETKKEIQRDREKRLARARQSVHDPRGFSQKWSKW